MRFACMALMLMAAASAPAWAQSVEDMNRAESELRESMAPAGVAVDRVAPDEIRLRMPSDITFDFDRSNVRREFMPRVRDLARTLNLYPSMSVGIVGHADALGSDGYNQDLSERRARSVAAALSDFGVGYRRINASGMGEMAPVDTNATEWGRARNRRVEIRLNAKPKD